jgi:uncharacterized membrane protein YdcZ (DUF606 family)
MVSKNRADPFRPTPRSARGLMLGGLASILPFFSGVVFYAWLELSPKSWIDPQCGLEPSTWLVFIPCLLGPPLISAITARSQNRGLPATTALVIFVLLLTAGACVVAFLCWFGKHMCGE